MKDHLAELVRASSSPAYGHNVAREYLQARMGYAIAASRPGVALVGKLHAILQRFYLK